MYTLRHVYSVFLMNEELYALGVVANTGMMLAVPSVQVQNQPIVRNFIADNLGIVPHFKCKLYYTVEYNVITL